MILLSLDRNTRGQDFFPATGTLRLTQSASLFLLAVRPPVLCDVITDTLRASPQRRQSIDGSRRDPSVCSMKLPSSLLFSDSLLFLPRRNEEISRPLWVGFKPPLHILFHQVCYSYNHAWDNGNAASWCCWSHNNNFSN